MRGAPPRLTLAMIGSGIIPADAGSTSRWLDLPFDLPDHPRGCGEHSPVLSNFLRQKGSSPRMRGARHFGDRPNNVVGIIPADAGSTHWRSFNSCASWDHPRGCGEHRHVACEGGTDRGSSPRMRGALSPDALDPDVFGIIPADAGST